ncbi:MAG: radical SAM protein [Caldilineales bacterium]
MTRTKIILYNPRAVFFTMPLALLAVGSALDPARYDVRIVDGRLEKDPVAAVLAEMDGAACLGISVLTGAPSVMPCRSAGQSRRGGPSLPVVWGGWHASLFPTDTLDEPSVDFTVQGQGEATFVELVERFAAGEWRPGGRAWASRAPSSGSMASRGATRRAMTDMNELPAHDYGLMAVERYYTLKGERQLDYISSTGCFFRCAFCADPFVFKRRWTALEPQRMGEEAETLWQRYRFDDLAFQDETFFTYRDRVIAVAEEFLRRFAPPTNGGGPARNTRFTWTATMRADQGVRLSDDAFALCVRSGLRRVMIGVESGSQEMMDWMKKDIRVEDVVRSAEMCVRHGVGAIFPFIVGFPGESDDSVLASLNLVKQLRSMSPQFETPIFYFKPYPGSQITDEVVRQGYSLPQTLDEWADFDFVGSSGPWVSQEKYELIERFKFYNRFAWGPETLRRRPLQAVARWRVRKDFYRAPVEKRVVDRLKPLPKLS